MDAVIIKVHNVRVVAAKERARACTVLLECQWQHLWLFLTALYTANLLLACTVEVWNTQDICARRQRMRITFVSTAVPLDICK